MTGVMIMSPMSNVNMYFFPLIFEHLYILHRLENRTRPVTAPQDGRRW